MEERDALKEKRAKLQASLAEEQGGREETVWFLTSLLLLFFFSHTNCFVVFQAERKQVLLELATEQGKEVEYEKEIATYAACDPETLKDKLKRAGIAKTAANRWTGLLAFIFNTTLFVSFPFALFLSLFF